MKSYLKEKHDMSVTEQAISYRMKKIQRVCFKF